MPFNPARYDSMEYRRCGRSGLRLPALSLGLWHGPGSYVDEAVSTRIVHAAFDRGITHFDLANNYGHPAGASEELFGRILRGMPRHELVISSKAGYRMWDGPYGEWGSRKHLLQSCDTSLKRLGVDHVDIFYSHRFDPETPLEETLGALETLVRQGKAIYAGISNYRDAAFVDAVRVTRERGGPPVIVNQIRYSLLDRAAESNVLPIAAAEQIGVIAFSPLAQGLLSGKYLHGVPPESRVALGKGNGALEAAQVTPEIVAKLNALHGIAQRRGQTLAQMALAWLLRDARITSVLIGASRPEQIGDCVAGLAGVRFDDAELRAIADAL